MDAVASVSQTGIADQALPYLSQVPAQPQVSDRSKTHDDAPVQPTHKDATAIVKELNDAMKMFNTSLSFSVDQDTGKTVIKVLDSTTKDVIRQIPPEDVLRTAARIKDLLGVLFDKKQ